MGRWTGYSLQASNNSQVHIITAYRPVSTSAGSVHTFYQKNWNILRNTGTEVPDPPKQFYKDLGTVIDDIHSQDEAVILMLDANEALSDNKFLLKFLATHQLVSLIHPVYDAPAT
jgi:hypothetical protein